MRRLVVLVLALALAAPNGTALALDVGGIVPLRFEPVSLAMYDGQSGYAFFPSKGVQDYISPDEPPRGYLSLPEPGQAGRNTQLFLDTDGEQNTQRIFALIKIKVVNYDSQGKEINGSDFYLQGLRGDVYPPHPFTMATTHILMEPKQVSFMDLGFDVPGGKYSLYYQTRTPDGKRVSDEVWRYDITIDRGPVSAIFRLLPELMARFVDAIFSFLGGLLGLND